MRSRVEYTIDVEQMVLVTAIVTTCILLAWTMVIEVRNTPHWIESMCMFFIWGEECTKDFGGERRGVAPVNKLGCKGVS